MLLSKFKWTVYSNQPVVQYTEQNVLSVWNKQGY